MAQTATINVRVDENIKREAEIMLDKLGMNISVLVNMTLRQLIMDEALPFLPKYKLNENMKARKAFVKAIENAQEESLINGNSEMTLEEINTMISEVRQEK